MNLSMCPDTDEDLLMVSTDAGSTAGALGHA
jgi:hypothetical protein